MSGLFYSALIAIYFFETVLATCPNDCKSADGVKRGVCRGPNWTCDCHDGWISGDCSERTCAYGPAWFDEAIGVDDAHNSAECSNMGICDRLTGLCTCRAGFSGIACERMNCPVDANGLTCAGHGRCMSMREYAEHQDDYKSFYSVSYNAWDADRIYGCVCDEGFTGYDCSLFMCPGGDDPQSPLQLLDEIQYIDCICPGTCSGSFRLSFRSDFTVDIPYSASANDIKNALDSLHRLDGVLVTLSGGTSVCDNDGAAAKIQFAQNPGNLPALIVHSSLSASGGTPTITVRSGGATSTYAGANSQNGNRENHECNLRGTCDRTTGICTCDEGFTSSNGGGGTGGVALANGTRGDCGVARWDITPNCPIDASNVICSGHGICLNSTHASGSETYQCQCLSGFTGHNCALLDCPTGTAWFDEATSSTVAHQSALCSNGGLCDYEKGTCTCAPHLGGSACSTILCPGASQDTGEESGGGGGAPAPAPGGEGGENAVCSGKGTCKTISAVALLAKNEFGTSLGYTYGASGGIDTWDKDSMVGCQCDQRSYHGPFLGDATDHYGYDCSQIQCPYGDDPASEGQHHETQTIFCQADGGTFTLSFYGYTTSAIAHNANAATVEAALEILSSIHVLYGVGVEVSIQNSGTTVCSDAGAFTDITFKQNLGDVPMLVLTGSSLTRAGGSVLTKMIEKQKGTYENEECSLRGKCYPLTGLCSCFKYYASSDGSGGGGSRADCGHRNVHQLINYYPVPVGG